MRTTPIQRIRHEKRAFLKLYPKWVYPTIFTILPGTTITFRFEGDAATTGGAVSADSIPESAAPAGLVPPETALDGVRALGTECTVLANDLRRSLVQAEHGLGRAGESMQSAAERVVAP